MPPGGRPPACWWEARASSACWRWAAARARSRLRSRGAWSSWWRKLVPLGPQLRRRQPLEVGAAGSVDGEGLAAGPGEGLGQLQVAVGLLLIGQVEFAGALGFGADDGVEAGVLAGSGQLDIEPVDVFGAGEADQGAAAGQALGAVAGGGVGQIDPTVALAAAAAVQVRRGQGHRPTVGAVKADRQGRSWESRAVMVPRLPLATPSSAMALWPHTTRPPTASWRSSTCSRSAPRRPWAARSS